MKQHAGTLAGLITMLFGFITMLAGFLLMPVNKQGEKLKSKEKAP